MHWKRFYYRNALKKILLEKWTAKDLKIGRHWKLFYYKNTLKRISQQKCHQNIFYRRNTLEKILLEDFIAIGFIFVMHSNSFYCGYPFKMFCCSFGGYIYKRLFSECYSYYLCYFIAIKKHLTCFIIRVEFKVSKERDLTVIVFDVLVVADLFQLEVVFFTLNFHG